jgi:hypothetical protein
MNIDDQAGWHAHSQRLSQRRDRTILEAARLLNGAASSA